MPSPPDGDTGLIYVQGVDSLRGAGRHGQVTDCSFQQSGGESCQTTVLCTTIMLSGRCLCDGFERRRNCTDDVWRTNRRWQAQRVKSALTELSPGSSVISDSFQPHLFHPLHPISTCTMSKAYPGSVHHAKGDTTSQAHLARSS